MTKTEKKQAIDIILWNIAACENSDDLSKGIEKLVKEIYSAGFSREMENTVSNTVNILTSNELNKFADKFGKPEQEKIEFLRPVGTTIFALIDVSSLPD